MDELFEFDLSDVDVAAFESVATTPPHSSPPPPPPTEATTTTTTTTIIAGEDGQTTALTDSLTGTTSELTLQTAATTITTTTSQGINSTASSPPQLSTTTLIHTSQSTTADQLNHHLGDSQQQHLKLQQQASQHDPLQLQQHHLSQQQLQNLQQQLQLPQNHQLQQHVSQQIAGQQPCKILLIPINSTSKPGQPGTIKHLLQLPHGASPIGMSALKTSASGNKKQQQNQQHQQLLQATPKNEADNSQFQTPTPPTPLSTNMIANEVPKRKPCNCTKSQCLKLYCDCFANGEFCSGCNCTNCFNSLSKEKERQKAISQCLERNPEAFRPKIGKAIKSAVGKPAPESIERRHTKGCNCKRSGCLKNYCECYEAKILCSNLCKCCGCKNYEESFERKSLMQLANSSSESARGILKNLLPTNNNSSTGREFTKCFITDKVIHASLACLLQSAQQAEKDGTQPNRIQNLIQTEMGKCLRMIVDSAADQLSSSTSSAAATTTTTTTSPKKR